MVVDGYSHGVVPKVFAAKPSTAQGQKQCTSILEEEGGPADKHSSTEDGDGEFESEDAPRLKLAGGKGKAMAKPTVCGGASSSLTKGLRSGSLAVMLPSGTPKKAAKTQPGSVKDEPIPSINLLCKTLTTKSSRVSARVSSLTEHPTVTIKNKKHLILKAHTYEKEEPVPIKAEELDAITQAVALPLYGCAQCSSSVQNQPCLFLGWGKWCNNCEAASKSLCTFHAEPVQHYFACKELAKCVEATPENVHTCIDCTSAAFHVFENSTNAIANAAQLFWACFEELSEVCSHASSSEGQDTLLGVVFEDCDFEDQAELVIQHPTAIIGDPKVEDADYHTVRSFTGVIHSERLKCAAAVSNAIAAVTGIPSAPPAVPAPTAPVPAKTVATSGKGKATKTPARQSCCSAKSKATMEGSSDEEASVIVAAEDTVMGNLDASSAPPETDLMNINNELEIIVNRNPSSGNIVEGHKIPFPKFLKNKKAALAAQRDREKAGYNTLAEQAAQAIIAGEKAYEAVNQARKHPCSSADLAFKDSSYIIAAADLAINNEASQSTLDAAMALVSTADHVNPSENVLRSREADLRNDVIATTHKIEYLLKYREFVVAHHAQVVQHLESCVSVPMEDTTSTPVTSSSKLD
ncbi:hypothetical protein IW261DRAFT_1570082 [Armillaria novae-zelandiae]|uniref:Uncharacterized protein n=1 Tax=Armillaria novae-zelandiae TaxID=153914 RepID=A0AA39T9A4_9AGAR|nr:hypothetical protein IW261DRAFT_1570082 [Armillaria novae-zelandiae]